MRIQLLTLVSAFLVLASAQASDPLCLPPEEAKEVIKRFRTGGEFSRVTLADEVIKDRNVSSLKTGNVNFQGGAWEELQIKGSEFTRAYFTAFKFKDVTLSDVDLRGSHFHQTVLNNVQFKNVDARAMQMDGVTLDGVHWDGVKLKGASIIFSKFKNCKFENMDWNKVVLVGTSFENCLGAPSTHQGTHQARK